GELCGSGAQLDGGFWGHYAGAETGGIFQSADGFYPESARRYFAADRGQQARVRCGDDAVRALCTVRSAVQGEHVCANPARGGLAGGYERGSAQYVLAG